MTGVGEARHFKFGVVIEEYYFMDDRLPLKRMCSGSFNHFIFGEIADNISETVQDRDSIYTGERLIGNHMWPIK